MKGKTLNFQGKTNGGREIVKSVKYVYWQEDDLWIGYLEEYPDYWTQGRTLNELEENLKDLFEDLSGGAIPHVRRMAELKVA